MAAKKKVPSKAPKAAKPVAKKPAKKRRARKAKRVTPRILNRAISVLQEARIVGAAPLARSLKVPRSFATVLLDKLAETGFLVSTGKERKRYTLNKEAAPLDTVKPTRGKARGHDDIDGLSLADEMRLLADALENAPAILRRAAKKIDSIAGLQKTLSQI